MTQATLTMKSTCTERCMMKHAANHTAWALGRQRRNGFHVRRVVWGLVLARAERRDDEEIRAASIMIEAHWKRRHPQPEQRA